MHWQLLWPAVGGLLVGLVGALTVPGGRALVRPLGPLLGLGAALGGNALVTAVLGQHHRRVGLVVAVVLAAIVVSGFCAYERARELPQG